jgi:hypothetical protein
MICGALRNSLKPRVNWFLLLLALLVGGLYCSSEDKPLQPQPRELAWRLMYKPATSPDLNGIWGISSNSVVAVGDSGVILHFGGRTWDAGWSGIITEENLAAVWGTSADNVYAVSWNGSILHLDGSVWNFDAFVDGNLRDIWGVSANDIFAVGESSNRRGMVVHYDGHGWTTTELPTMYPLGAIWGSSHNNIFAGGEGGIYHFDGSVWKEFPPGPNSFPIIRGIWGWTPQDIWMVGTHGRIFHYNDTSWTTFETACDEALTSVWGWTADSAFAVGRNGSLLRYHGSEWELLDPVSTVDLNCVWGSSFDNVYAVGEQGIILRYSR